MIKKDWNFCYQILQAIAMLDKTLKVSIFMFEHFPTIPKLLNLLENVKTYNGSKNPLTPFQSFWAISKQTEDDHKEDLWHIIRDKIFKSGPNKVCRRQLLKNWKGYGLRKQTLEYSRILCPTYLTENFHLIPSQYIAMYLPGAYWEPCQTLRWSFLLNS